MSVDLASHFKGIVDNAAWWVILFLLAALTDQLRRWVRREKQAYLVDLKVAAANAQMALLAASDKQIEDLKANAEKAQKDVSALTLENETLRQRWAITLARLPDTAFEKAKQYWAVDAHDRANAIVMDWIDCEGDAVSQLLVHHAEWLAEFGDDTLVASEWYATVAHVLWPQNRETAQFRTEIRSYCARSSFLTSNLTSDVQIKAAITWDNPNKASEHGDLGMAADTETAAVRRYNLGCYRLALSAIEMAMRLRLHAVGATATQTLKAQQIKVQILYGLGRWRECLKLANSVAEGFKSSLEPASHRDTLYSRYWVAKILKVLGPGSDELLQIAKNVEQGQTDHLGSSDPDTLNTRLLVADILYSLNRDHEALGKAEALLQDYAAHPSFKSDTLATQFLVVKILNSLDRNDDALEKAETLERDEVAYPEHGDSHPQTLAVRYRIAKILHSLDRNDEALQKAEAVERDYTANLDLGSSHPDTLRARWLIAEILYALGRRGEVLLQNAEDVAHDQSAQLGPSHPDTLATLRLIARIRADLDGTQ